VCPVWFVAHLGQEALIRSVTPDWSGPWPWWPLDGCLSVAAQRSVPGSAPWVVTIWAGDDLQYSLDHDGVLASAAVQQAALYGARSGPPPKALDSGAPVYLRDGVQHLGLSPRPAEGVTRPTLLPGSAVKLHQPFLGCGRRSGPDSTPH
jgi:hypothetical protein